MKNKIPVLVTGGKGMLGHAFAKQLARFSEFTVQALGRNELDVRNPQHLNAYADWVSGGWIVHCAARVDVEGCAREPDDARAIIVDGTRNVAELAERSGARLLYPQSFLVYDGKSNPIAEDEAPRPLSLYGQLKYEAEKIVCDNVVHPLIICMAGFFGGEERDKNFVGRIIPVMKKALDEGKCSFEVGDRVWQPTWTDDLAFNSVQLMQADAQGRYQMACLGHATFADIAHEITVALGWADRLRVTPVDASKVSQSELGRRPDVAILSCQRLADEALNLQRDWRSTLHTYLRHPFFNQYRLDI
jgi:dTDP-4-dehydrorhamnose reductase